MKKVVLAIFLATVFLFIGCDSKEESKSIQDTAETVEKRDGVTGEVEETVSKVGAEMKETKVDTKEADMVQEAEKKVLDAAKEVQQEAQEVEKGLSEVIESAKNNEKSVVDEKITTLSQKAQEADSVDAKSLYGSKCAGCHGAKGEKVALGKSNILAGQSKEELIEKMVGYKDGTYGGSMKQIMATQVSSLTKEQIEALADYISKL